MGIMVPILAFHVDQDPHAREYGDQGPHAEKYVDQGPHTEKYGDQGPHTGKYGHQGHLPISPQSHFPLLSYYMSRAFFQPTFSPNLFALLLRFVRFSFTLCAPYPCAHPPFLLIFSPCLHPTNGHHPPA